MLHQLPSNSTPTFKTIRIVSTSPPTCRAILRPLLPLLSKLPTQKTANQYVLVTFYAHLWLQTSEPSPKHRPSPSNCLSLAKNPPKWSNARLWRHPKRLLLLIRASNDPAKLPSQSKFLAWPHHSLAFNKLAQQTPTNTQRCHLFQRRSTERTRSSKTWSSTWPVSNLRLLPCQRRSTRLERPPNSSSHQPNLLLSSWSRRRSSPICSKIPSSGINVWRSSLQSRTSTRTVRLWNAIKSIFSRS